MWKLAVFPKIKFVQNNQLIIFLKAEGFGYYSIILCSIPTKNIFTFLLEQYSNNFAPPPLNSPCGDSLRFRVDSCKK